MLNKEILDTHDYNLGEILHAQVMPFCRQIVAYYNMG